MMVPSRPVRTAVLALAVLTFAGCTAMRVGSFVERGIDFTQYRTYDWAPAEHLSTGDPRLDNNPFFQERVQASVERELAARGFEKRPAGPDLLIRYHASISQRIDVRGAGDGYGYCDEDCRPYVYEAGTLGIDLVDPETNRLIWRGWADDSVDGVIDDQAWMERKIDEAVARILERLPRRL